MFDSRLLGFALLLLSAVLGGVLITGAFEPAALVAAAIAGCVGLAVVRIRGRRSAAISGGEGSGGIVAIDREGRVTHIDAIAAKTLGVAPEASLGRAIEEVTGGGEISSELRRLESIRRDFVANVSHELKTPITAIRGLVETLIDDEAMESGTRESFLAKIRDQSLRLSALVTDLLTLSRLEAASDTSETESLDLSAVVRAATDALQPVSEAREITVGTEVPDEPVTVAGDREALLQMVGNLLDNALKYSPEGGQVWLRLQAEAGSALLEVEDSGIGIEESHLPRIFERFYRVDRARSRELGGTGLGLSIVKHVCLGHGGEISVSSEAGRGSVFRVRIPLSPSP